MLAILYLPAGLYAAPLEINIDHGYFAPVIDDQSQAAEDISKIPGNASVVDEKAFADQRDSTIKDITDYVPGVIDQPRDGAESNRLSLRGSGLANIFQGSGLLVLEDGIPINMADGEFEFPVIDPWLTKYAEIYPGANGLEFGASNFGGAVNFITPNGTTDNGYDFRSEVGSFGTIHGQISSGQQWKGGDMFAAASGFYQDGFRENNEQATSRFNANIGSDLTDDFTNRVYISHTHSFAEIPGAITKAGAEEDPTQANYLNLKDNYQRNLDITRIADKAAWEEGPDRIDTTLFYTYRRLENPVTTYEFQDSNDTGIRTKYTHDAGLNQFIAGVNSYYGDAIETRFQNNDASPGTHILSRDSYASTNEIYSQYQQHLVEKLYGILGAQGSYASRDISQSFPYIATQDKDYAGFNPRVGLRYDFGPQTQAFTNLSRSFEPPTNSDLSGSNHPGFTDLSAQTATTAEFGARGLSDGIHWQAAYYHGWLKDELVNYRFADGDTATVNVPKSKRDGIELGLDGDVEKNIWVPDDAISARVAYTLSHFTLDHNPLYGNNDVPGVPEHFIRAETLYHHPSGISFGPNIEWSPKSAPIDLTNTLYSPSYAIFGARAFWESKDGKWNIYIEGRNLLDKNYIATYNVIPDAGGKDGKDFYPGEGRAVYAGVRLKL